MKFGLSIITAALLLTSNVESRWTPKPGLTWSYGIALETSDMYVEYIILNIHVFFFF